QRGSMNSPIEAQHHGTDAGRFPGGRGAPRRAGQSREPAAADPRRGGPRPGGGVRGTAVAPPQPGRVAELRGGPHRPLPGARHRDPIWSLLLLQRPAVPDADGASALLPGVRHRPLPLLFPFGWTPRRAARGAARRRLLLGAAAPWDLCDGWDLSVS